MKTWKVVSLLTLLDSLMRLSIAIAVTMPWQMERRSPVRTSTGLLVKKGVNKQPLEVLRRNPHPISRAETIAWPSFASAEVHHSPLFPGRCLTKPGARTTSGGVDRALEKRNSMDANAVAE